EPDTFAVAMGMLTRRPKLHRQIMGAVEGALAVLFGEGNYERFAATRPSIPDYARLLVNLSRVYGVSLGEAFASLGPSTNGGETQKQTVEPGTESTSGTPSSGTKTNG